MSTAPETRASLLLRLRDGGDDPAWQRFLSLYGPAIESFLGKRGLQPHDAADVTQEVLLAVARAVPGFEYDRRRGSFRGWLFTVVQNKLRNYYASRQRRLQGTGSTGVHENLNQLAADQESSLWDREYEERMFVWACDQVREKVAPHNWQAFCSTAIVGRDTHDVAEQLGTTVAAVRLAKSRVMAQIRKLIDELEAE